MVVVWIWLKVELIFLYIWCLIEIVVFVVIVGIYTGYPLFKAIIIHHRIIIKCVVVKFIKSRVSPLIILKFALF